ncbi:MAG: hypothetical protein OEX12_01580 [Gammaproteobacteria bacterium]|nr:hypothetical protein [Gammaproteobacteria bacterium]
MDTKVQISLDKTVYDRLLELQLAPYDDINAVLEKLLYYNEHKNSDPLNLSVKEHHYTYDEELKRYNDGVYSGSGIGT